jgi:hypothetical protein
MREVNTGCLKKRKFCNFLRYFSNFLNFHQNNPMRGSMWKMIARIAEPWKCFPGPDSVKRCVYWSENRLIHGQGSVFKVQKCAQSISRIENPYRLIWWKLKTWKFLKKSCKNHKIAFFGTGRQSSLLPMYVYNTIIHTTLDHTCRTPPYPLKLWWITSNSQLPNNPTSKKFSAHEAWTFLVRKDKNLVSF